MTTTATSEQRLRAALRGDDVALAAYLDWREEGGFYERAGFGREFTASYIRTCRGNNYPFVTDDDGCLRRLEPDAFTQAYIACAMWASDDGDERFDGRYSRDDFSRDAMERIHADCARFQEENAEWMSSSSGQAGHDFWLSRNGHGAGFMDGDEWGEIGDLLHRAAKAYGECHLYVSDDGKIEIA